MGVELARSKRFRRSLMVVVVQSALYAGMKLSGEEIDVAGGRKA